MRSRPAAALLLLLALLPGGAAAAPARKADPAPAPAPPPEMEAKKREVLALLDEGHVLADKLRQFPPLDTVKDWGAFCKEREELRAKLMQCLLKLNTADSEFGKFKYAWNMQSIAAGMAQLVQGGSIPADAADRLAQINDNDRLQNRVAGFSRDAETILKTDEATFTAFVQTKASQRRQTLIFSAAAAVILLGGAVFGWLYARRMRTLEAQLVTARGTLVTGPGGLPAAVPAGLLPMGSSGPETLAPGMVVGGHFRVERELGKGGMGIVYEAMDAALGRKVALKRMRKELCEDVHELEFFMKEARLVAALKHPNIVEIHHVLREGNQLLLVFEFVPGDPLNRILSKVRRTDLKSAKPILGQVAAALDHAHKAKVVHRDLKPANVMITPQGQIKVMDFGIAHQAKLTLAKLTRAAGWGTPPYMAPEQEMGQVCAASDVFALGVMCYEMLAGRLPYPGPNFLEQKKVRFYVPASKLGLPAELDPVLAKALDPRPEARFASAGEFTAALDAVRG